MTTGNCDDTEKRYKVGLTKDQVHDEWNHLTANPRLDLFSKNILNNKIITTLFKPCSNVHVYD